jgi:hypothetical protein
VTRPTRDREHPAPAALPAPGIAGLIGSVHDIPGNALDAVDLAGQDELIDRQPCGAARTEVEQEAVRAARE